MRTWLGGWVGGWVGDNGSPRCKGLSRSRGAVGGHPGDGHEAREKNDVDPGVY